MCGFCQDRGWRGGSIDGPYAGPYRWCACPAADERRDREPELVDEGNCIREDLMRIFAAKDQSLRERKGLQAAEQVIAGDDYKGEF